MKINYFKATPEDFQLLYDLAVLFTEHSVTMTNDRKKFFMDNWEERFKKEIIDDLNNNNCFYFIAESEDKIPIGYILAKKCDECMYFVIEELFIKEGYRGNNIGQELLEFALAEGKKFDLEIRVEIFNWNKEAKRFYLRNGFEEDSEVLVLKSK